MEAADVGSIDELSLFPQEEWYEQVLRYGLYLGAAFQLICILAVIISPSSDIKDDLDNDDDSASSDDEDLDGQPASGQGLRSSRTRRLEKKKRR